MSEPFIAEIRMVGFNFAARGWALCDGQLLPISQNTALFSIVGTIYGGDGETTLALPDLRGRTPIHVSSSQPIGNTGGAESHTLTTGQMPSHSHSIQGTTADADSGSPANAMFAHAEEETYGHPGATPPSGQTLASTGNNIPHNNMQPYLTLNFQIALQGLFPSQS